MYFINKMNKYFRSHSSKIRIYASFFYCVRKLFQSMFANKELTLGIQYFWNSFFANTDLLSTDSRSMTITKYVSNKKCLKMDLLVLKMSVKMNVNQPWFSHMDDNNVLY